MKFATSFSALVTIIPLVSQVCALAVPDSGLVARQRGGKGRGGKAANAGAANAGTAAAAASATAASATAAAAAGGAAASGANATAAAAGAAAAGGNPQTSLTLDPSVIATGFANNGQNVPAAGQVASLTSTNNFINFCATVPNLPITNGKQIATGSCNPAPIGIIPSTSNMPSAKFTVPKNGDTVTANQAFTISMAINNLDTGNFVNAEENYFAAPQQLNAQGAIVGHSHVVVETLTALDQTTPTDPNKFAFFKGLNAAAVGGILTADVTKGLPAGAYRLCSINSAANHQPAIVPIAQHGSLDDCVYFTASAGGAAAAAGNATAAGGAAAGAGAAVAGAGGAAAGAAGAAAGAKGAAAAAAGGAAAAGAGGAAAGAGGAAAAGAGGATAGAGGAAVAAGGAATGAKAAAGAKAAGGNGGKGRFAREQ